MATFTEAIIDELEATKAKATILEENVARLKQDLADEIERSKKYIKERDALGEQLSETVEAKARETKTCGTLSLRVERSIKILEQATTLFAAQQALEVLRGSEDEPGSSEGTSGVEAVDPAGKSG